MKRPLIWALAAGLLLSGVARASPNTPASGQTSLLVMFEPGVPEAARRALHLRAGGQVTGSLPEIALDRVSVAPWSAALYDASGLVRAVEAPRSLEIFGAKPNDPLLKLQWPLKRLDAFKAWDIESGAKAQVTVGVIDTGVDATHPDLEGRVLEGFDFLELDDDAYDDHGHGTHVAGIIAANVSNREGIAGLSQGALVIPMKACTSGGACPMFETYAGAIDAVRRGASILNMSLGGAGECTTIDQAVFDWIRDQGVLTVVAAGNSAKDGNPSINPANCDNTLAVGAIDQRDRKAEFSSHGDFVDIAAPGVEVWSTMPPLVSILSPHIGYAPASGTSMASPYIAAAASLLKAHHPDWDPEQIEKRLLETASDAGRRGRDDFFGEGIIDLTAALR